MLQANGATLGPFRAIIHLPSRVLLQFEEREHALNARAKWDGTGPFSVKAAVYDEQHFLAGIYDDLL
jgi:hypothetical protein